MNADIAIDGHELSPYYGNESLGYWAVCDCGDRLDGLTMAEVLDAYEQHYAALCLSPGVGKARAALAEALERKSTELETTR